MAECKKFYVKFILFILAAVLFFSFVSAIERGRGLKITEQQHTASQGIELVFVEHASGDVVLKNQGTQTAHDVETKIWIGEQQFKGIKKDVLEAGLVVSGGALHEILGKHGADSIRVTATSIEGATAEATIILEPINPWPYTLFLVLLVILPIFSGVIYKFSKHQKLAKIAFMVWIFLIALGFIRLLIT